MATNQNKLQPGEVRVKVTDPHDESYVAINEKKLREIALKIHSAKTLEEIEQMRSDFWAHSRNIGTVRNPPCRITYGLTTTTTRNPGTTSLTKPLTSN